ncbi:hypothetical protein ACOZ82_001983 [Vibrio parahaemolyticus]
MATHVLRVPVDTGEQNTRKAVRDRLIEGDNGGIRFLADLAFPWCYPGGDIATRPPASNPQAGAAIRDVSETISDATFHVTSGLSETIFAGNGFDFSSITATSEKRQAIETPSDVYKTIASKQQFLICFYVKLPEQADWNESPSIYPMLTSTEWGSMYPNSGELAVISQISGGLLSFRRQTSLTTVDRIDISASGFYGKFCQIAIWRTGDEFGGSIRSVDDHQSSVQSAGLLNSVDVSNLSCKFGGSASGFVVESSGNEGSKKYRIYRMFIEDLNMSGRDPNVVISSDWVRTINRGVFS